MNKKEFCLIIFICLIPGIIFLFKPELIGIDSYAYYNSICFNTPLPATTGILSQYAFNLLSCNQTIIKILLAGLLLFNTLIVSRFGELFHKKGWIAGPILFLSQIWINWHFLFEDDQLAYPFIFLGLYWAWKGELKQDNKLKYIGLLSVCIAGLFWKASIYFLIGLIPLIPITTLIVLPFIALNFHAFISKISPDLTLTNVETIPFIAFPSFFFLLFGIKKISFNQKFFLQTIYFLILAALNANFAVFVLPFLAIACMKWFYELNDKQKFFFKFLVIGTLLAISLTVFSQMPNQDTWIVLNESQKLALENKKPLNIDWTFRYYAENQNMDFNIIMGYQKQKNYVVTWKELDCNKILVKENIGLYEC